MLQIKHGLEVNMQVYELVGQTEKLYGPKRRL